MNIMYVSVAERTFEIGLRKAVGAKRRTILMQFLTEAVLLTLAGGILGVLLGAAVSFAVAWGAQNSGINWEFSLSIFSIFLATIFSMAVGIIFGLSPAKKAAALDPIEALIQQ